MQRIDVLSQQVREIQKDRDFWHTMYGEAKILNQAKSLQVSVSLLYFFEKSLLGKKYTRHEKFWLFSVTIKMGVNHSSRKCISVVLLNLVLN